VICLTLFLQACGSSSKTDNQEQVKKDTREYLLTEDNYISMAKYNFIKESIQLKKTRVADTNHNSKFRSHPGAAKESQRVKNSLKISSVTPFNKYIQSMNISSDKRTISIEVKNKIYVTVSLIENGKVISTEKMPLEKFKSFDIDQMGEIS
jgi:hypothetical protein